MDKPSLYQAYRRQLAGLPASKGAAGKMPLMLAGIALAIGGSMTYDSFRGSKSDRETRLSSIKEKAAMEDMEFGWGRWNNMPFMDRMAHKLKRFFEYGPGDLFIRWNEFKIYTSSLTDSIFGNILPLGIGASALYIGLGPDRVNQMIGKAWDTMFHKQWLSDGLKADLQRILGSAFRPLGQGLAAMGRWPLKSGTNLLFTLGALTAGAFAANRFRDVYENDAGDQFSRSIFSEKNSF